MGNSNHDEVGGYQLLKMEVEAVRNENEALKKENETLRQELADKTSQNHRLETEVSTLKVSVMFYYGT